MRNILSYGALSKENSILRKNVKKLENLYDWLLKETKVQSKIIDQLKWLSNSMSAISLRFPDDSHFCDQGHYGCKILHKRFNLVKLPLCSCPKIDPTSIPTSGELQFNRSSDSESKPNLLSKLKEDAVLPGLSLSHEIPRNDRKENEAFQIKRLSKFVDFFQAKYGLPSQHRHKIMVASDYEIFVESRETQQLAVRSSTQSLTHRRFRSRIPIPNYYCTIPFMGGKNDDLTDRNSNASNAGDSSSNDTYDESDSSEYPEHDITDGGEASELELNVQQYEDFHNDDENMEGNSDGQMHICEDSLVVPPNGACENVHNDVGLDYVQQESTGMSDPEDTVPEDAFLEVVYGDDAMCDFENEEEDEPWWYDSGECEGEER